MHQGRWSMCDRVRLAELRNNTTAATKPRARREEANCTPAPHLHTGQVVGKYELGRVIAGGDFDCRTRLCTHIVTGGTYVARIYDKIELYKVPWMWQRVREAIQVQRLLPRHDNILEMVECFETASSVYLLTRLFDATNLTTLYAGVSGGTLSCSTPACHAAPENRPTGAAVGGDATAETPSDDEGSDEHEEHYCECDNDCAEEKEEQEAGVRGTDRRYNVHSIGADRTSMAMTRGYFVQVVQALLHMNRHGVVHLGIAPDHVLVNHRGQVRLSNLVVCRFCESDPAKTDSPSRDRAKSVALTTAATAISTHGPCRDCRICEFRGTMQTVAPEMLTGQPYNPHLGESWSLGVLLYFMLHDGRYPHDSANSLRHIAYNRIRPPRGTLCASAKDLLARLLQVNPADRLPVEAVLFHPFCAYPALSTLSKQHEQSLRQQVSPQPSVEEVCVAKGAAESTLLSPRAELPSTHTLRERRCDEPRITPTLSHSNTIHAAGGSRHALTSGVTETHDCVARTHVAPKAVWSEHDRAILDAAMDYFDTLPWSNINFNAHRQGSCPLSSCASRSFRHSNVGVRYHTHRSSIDDHCADGGSIVHAIHSARASHPCVSDRWMGNMPTGCCRCYCASSSATCDTSDIAFTSIKHAARVLQYYWRVRCHGRLYRLLHDVLVSRTVDGAGAPDMPLRDMIATYASNVSRRTLLSLLTPFIIHRHPAWSHQKLEHDRFAISGRGTNANTHCSLSRGTSMTGSTPCHVLPQSPVAVPASTPPPRTDATSTGCCILCDESMIHTRCMTRKPYLHTPYEYMQGTFRCTMQDA